ncbi:Zinc finger CCCH domain-containing protein 13, partial [Ophiophagus hannah]
GERERERREKRERRAGEREERERDRRGGERRGREGGRERGRKRGRDRRDREERERKVNCRGKERQSFEKPQRMERGQLKHSQSRVGVWGAWVDLGRQENKLQRQKARPARVGAHAPLASFSLAPLAILCSSFWSKNKGHSSPDSLGRDWGRFGGGAKEEVISPNITRKRRSRFQAASQKGFGAGVGCWAFAGGRETP